MTASAVPGLMIVPIWLRLMLCPPKDEGHIPPVIYGPPVAISSRESGMLRHPSCSKIPVEGGVPEPFEGDKNEEVAVLKCMYARLRTTSTERHECVSSLVGRVLVTDSTPGSSSHAHFLAAMVADHVKEKSISLGLAFPGTPAHIDKIPQGGPAPRTQKKQKYEGTQMSIEQQKYWSAKVGRGAIKLAVSTEPGQRWPRQGSNPKTSCSGDDCNRKDTVLDKRIQGCMRQQPCALSSEQPQQLLGAAWTSVSQRHAWGRLARLLLHEAT